MHPILSLHLVVVSFIPTIAPCIKLPQAEDVENYNRFGEVMGPTEQ